MVYEERVKTVGHEQAQKIYLELVTNCIAHHDRITRLATYMPMLKRQLTV